MPLADALDHWEPAINALLTFALIVATLAMARISAKHLREAMELREWQTGPDVEVGISAPYPTILEMYVRNVGRSPAYNIRISAFPDFQIGFENRSRGKISEQKFSSIHSMGVNQNIQIWIGQYRQFKGQIIEFTITFSDIRNRKYERKYTVDINAFEGTQIPRSDTYNINETLKKIESEFRHVTSGFRRVHVISEPPFEHERYQPYLPTDRIRKRLPYRRRTSRITSR